MAWTEVATESTTLNLNGEFTQYVNNETGTSYSDYSTMIAGSTVTLVSQLIAQYAGVTLGPILAALPSVSFVASEIISGIQDESNKAARDEVIEQGQRFGGGNVTITTTYEEYQTASGNASTWRSNTTYLFVP